MILMLSCLFYLFLNAVISSRVSAETFSGRREQKEHQGREIAPISLPPFYQLRVKGRTGYAPRAYLKGMLHQETRVKSKDLFTEKYKFSEKCLSFQKISAQFRAKKLSTI